MSQPQEFFYPALNGLAPALMGIGMTGADADGKHPLVVSAKTCADELMATTVCVLVYVDGSVKVGASKLGNDAARADATAREAMA